MVLEYLNYIGNRDDLKMYPIKIVERLSPASQVAFFDRMDKEGNKPLFAACHIPWMLSEFLTLIENMSKDDRQTVLEITNRKGQNVFLYSATICSNPMQPLFTFLCRQDLIDPAFAVKVLSHRVDGQNIIHLGGLLPADRMLRVIDTITHVGGDALLQALLQQRCSNHSTVIMGAKLEALQIIIQAFTRLQLDPQDLVLSANSENDTALTVAANKCPASIPVLLNTLSSQDPLTVFNYIHHVNRAGHTAMSLLCQHWHQHPAQEQLNQAIKQFQETLRQLITAQPSSQQEHRFFTPERQSLRRCNSEPVLSIHPPQ